MELEYNILKYFLFLTSESSIGTSAGCFPSGSKVYTENGPREIDSVQNGDMVLAADNTGKLIYSEVCKYYISLANSFLDISYF